MDNSRSLWVFAAMLGLVSFALYPFFKTGLGYSESNSFNTQNTFTNHGFSSPPKIAFSAGGNAMCVEGTLHVPVVATNQNITYDGPRDNMELTALITSFMKVNSDTIPRLVGGQTSISDTFSIFSRLCVPREEQSRKNIKTIQFLTHGGTTDNTYWDFEKGYSYVDSAAEKGYATFSYDRLGTGKSQHPDPIQIVQQSVQVELAHTLVSWLKNGKIAGLSFRDVVGVGHSLGSAFTQAVSARYPGDFSALILSGHSAFSGGAFIAMAASAQQIAKTEPSKRFEQLGHGYITPAPVKQAVLFGFYYYPSVDLEIFERQFDTRQTNALGEMLTAGSAYMPVPGYTNPVLIINGQHDFFYCQGDCVEPADLTAQALSIFFPNASSKSRAVNIPHLGHNINLHTGASKVFDKVHEFLVESDIGLVTQ